MLSHEGMDEGAPRQGHWSFGLELEVGLLKRINFYQLWYEYCTRHSTWKGALQLHNGKQKPIPCCWAWFSSELCCEMMKGWSFFPLNCSWKSPKMFTGPHRVSTTMLILAWNWNSCMIWLLYLFYCVNLTMSALSLCHWTLSHPLCYSCVISNIVAWWMVLVVHDTNCIYSLKTVLNGFGCYTFCFFGDIFNVPIL